MNNIHTLYKKFPHAKSSARLLSKYLDIIELDLQKDVLKEDHLNRLFLLYVKNYLQFTIDPDQLSELFEKTVALINDPETKNCNIASCMLSWADLEIYLRRDPQKAYKTIKDILQKYQQKT